MEGDGMSKHSISGKAEGEFWKRVRYGAAAAVTVGTGVYAVTSVLKQQGVVTNLVSGIQQACQAAAPQFAPDAPPPESADSDAQAEQLAVLKLQLEYAMQRRDINRVRELAAQVDQIERALALEAVSSSAGAMRRRPGVLRPPEQHTAQR